MFSLDIKQSALFKASKRFLIRQVTNQNIDI